MNIVPYDKIDANYMKEQDSCIYVHDESMYGDHLRKDVDGADSFWYNSENLGNRYGFITYIHKKKDRDYTFYTLFKLGEYSDLVYPVEEILLVDFISKNQDKYFIIDPLGYGTPNDTYLIFDYVIRPRLYKALEKFDNGILLWDKLESRYLTNK